MKVIYYNMDIFSIALAMSDAGNTGLAVCITTNGCTKKYYGTAVMGKGIARQASFSFPEVPAILGQRLREGGNHAYLLETYARGEKQVNMLSFPTKNNWRQPSDIELIRQSAKEIVAICDACRITRCYLPAVGCGCGGLDWKRDVEPVLREILDDRFLAIVQPALVGMQDSRFMVTEQS